MSVPSSLFLFCLINALLLIVTDYPDLRPDLPILECRVYYIKVNCIFKNTGHFIRMHMFYVVVITI